MPSASTIKIIVMKLRLKLYNFNIVTVLEIKFYHTIAAYHYVNFVIYQFRYYVYATSHRAYKGLSG